MQNHRLLAPLLAALLVPFWFAVPAAFAESIVHDNDRIVFCGDSITGQGGNGGATGWVGLIKEGLAIAHPQGHQTLTALGGSGATVGAWQNIMKRSGTASMYLDVHTVDVKATLDGGADIVVVMLGMNDVLSPSLKNDPAAFDAWAAHYHDLIESLKARTHPRLVALATITPCTEDLNSPKNRVEAELNSRLATLAAQEKGLVLPTHEAMAELLAAGRVYRPDFHITVDFVHPAPAGHLAIAVGMLRGLGESDAAAKLIEKYSRLFRPADKDLPALSYILSPQPASPDEPVRHFAIHYQWTAPAASATEPFVTATAPAGWKVEPSRLTGAKGDFQVSGTLGELVNKVTLSASAGDLKKDAEIDIPAGWRIAVGGSKGTGWSLNSIYDPAKDAMDIDKEIAGDDVFKKPVTFPLGETSPWQLYMASFNFTGHENPASVDMAAVTFFKYHDVAYGARWIYSAKDRPVDVVLGSNAFAGMFAETVWLNGDSLFAGKIFAEPGHKKTVEGKLTHGWNRLVFKSSYVQWQWQFTVDLAGKPGDDLVDLRYATAPQ